MDALNFIMHNTLILYINTTIDTLLFYPLFYTNYTSSLTLNALSMASSLKSLSLLMASAYAMITISHLKTPSKFAIMIYEITPYKLELLYNATFTIIIHSYGSLRSLSRPFKILSHPFTPNPEMSHLSRYDSLFIYRKKNLYIKLLLVHFYFSYLYYRLYHSILHTLPYTYLTPSYPFTYYSSLLLLILAIAIR